MKLNAQEIKELDEIRTDESAVNAMLEVALNFYTNRANELAKSTREWWERLGEKHGFEPAAGYSVKKVDGLLAIVKSESA
jgi:hypothetical protein